MTSTAPTPSRGNPAALTRARAEASVRMHRDAVAALYAAADRGQALTASAGVRPQETTLSMRPAPRTWSTRRTRSNDPRVKPAS